MATIRRGYIGMSHLVTINWDRIIALLVVAVALVVAESITPR